jgi:ethanolamine utilization protein EutL
VHVPSKPALRLRGAKSATSLRAKERIKMAILDPLYGTPLAVQLIPQVDRNFAEHLKLRDDQRSIGLLSVDNDDATYTAIDEATKMANVEVVYARSFYSGAKQT